MQVHLSRNYIPVMKSPPQHTSPPFMVATFLTTRLIVVLQPSGYSCYDSRLKVLSQETTLVLE